MMPSRRSTALAAAAFLLFASSLSAQDLVKLERTEHPNLEFAVRSPILGSVGDNLLLLGGWVGPADSASWSESAFVLSGDSWARAPELDGLSLPTAAAYGLGDDLLLIGGRSESGWSDQILTISSGTGGLQVDRSLMIDRAVAHPAAHTTGQTLYVAGFSDETAGRQILVASIDFAADEPTWTHLPPLAAGSGDRITLAFQDGGINLTQSGPTSSKMHRHTELTGWVEKDGAIAPDDILAAMTMGQAHVAYVTDTDGMLEVWSYSVIADAWADLGSLGPATEGASISKFGGDYVHTMLAPGGATTHVVETAFEVGKRPFHWIDFGAVAVYLTGMILIGFYFSRREEGTEDFFVGGRKMPWWAVGFSLYATGTSAISFMAIPAKSYATDWLYLAQNAIGIIAIIPVALIIVPLIRRLNLTTTYEYLEMRFHVIIRLMGSILNMTYQLGARMSVVLFLPALALSAVTGVDVVTSIVFMGVIATVYTVLGGIKAVIWTDVVQVVVLLGGAFLCLGIIISGIDGGLGELMAVTTADNKFHMFDWRFDLTIPTVWLFLILATADTITWPRDQVMVQRVLSTKTAKEAGFSVWTLAAIVIPGSLLFFSLGTALYGFYKVSPEKLSPLLNLDATLPFFIAAELPAGVAGLIIAALFAASMSTLDSSMNSVSTLIVVDFYQRFKKGVSDAKALRVAKLITVGTGIFGTLFALMLTRYSLPSLWDTFIMLTGLLGGGFGGVYALGMFTRRTNWQGAFVGIIASIVTVLLVRAYTDIHVLLYVGVAVIACVVIGYLSSLLFPPPGDQLKGLTVFKEDAV